MQFYYVAIGENRNFSGRERKIGVFVCGRAFRFVFRETFHINKLTSVCVHLVCNWKKSISVSIPGSRRDYVPYSGLIIKSLFFYVKIIQIPAEGSAGPYVRRDGRIECMGINFQGCCMFSGRVCFF